MLLTTNKNALQIFTIQIVMTNSINFFMKEACDLSANEYYTFAFALVFFRNGFWRQICLVIAKKFWPQKINRKQNWEAMLN